MYKICPAILFTVLLFGCSGQEAAAPVEPASQIQDQEQVLTESALGSGIDLQYMDTSIAPGDDFYRYVNGIWLSNTEI